MTAAISIKNLHFKYGMHRIIDGVSLEIESGKYVGILGPNGGGKSTFLKLILGLLTPESGEIKIFGIDRKVYPRKWEIGYVPQRAAQDNPDFPATVEEIVTSGRTPGKRWWEKIYISDQKIIQNVMEKAGIKVMKYKLISELSGGEKQRTYVARALAGEPKILVLDEPFVGLDVESQNDFYTFLKKLNREEGLTILFVSHDVDVISREADEIICLNRRLVCAGPPEETINKNLIEELYGKRVTHLHHDISHAH